MTYEINELEVNYVKCKSQSDTLRDTFVALKREMGEKAVFSQTGQKLSKKCQQEIIENDLQIDFLLSCVRLENIQLQRELKMRQLQMKLQENKAGGVQLIDIEQLKIENRTLNSKIDERQESILKTKKKTDHLLIAASFLKQKTFSFNNYLQENQKKLEKIKEEMIGKKKLLVEKKQLCRNVIEEEKKKKNNLGFSESFILLQDYENTQKEVDELKHEIHQMEMSINKYKK